MPRHGLESRTPDIVSVVHATNLPILQVNMECEITKSISGCLTKQFLYIIPLYFFLVVEMIILLHCNESCSNEPVTFSSDYFCWSKYCSQILFGNITMYSVSQIRCSIIKVRILGKLEKIWGINWWSVGTKVKLDSFVITKIIEKPKICAMFAFLRN